MTNTYNQVHPAWRVIAIILIIVFVMVIAWNVYWNMEYKKEVRETNICYYNICSDYPDAEYDYINKVCDCYDYDLFGDLVYAKSEYMGKQ